MRRDRLAAARKDQGRAIGRGRITEGQGGIVGQSVRSQRRNFLIKRGLQIGAVLYMFFIVLAILAFHTWLAYWRIGQATAALVGRTTLASVLLQDVIVTIVFMIVFVAFTGILGSHKVAGPIYRFEQVLRKVQRGDISEIIRLRKGDLLQDLAEEFNLALSNLRDYVAEDQMQLLQAAKIIAEARDRLPYPEVQSRLQVALGLIGRVGGKLVLEPAGKPGRLAEQINAVVQSYRAAAGTPAAAPIQPAPAAATETPGPLPQAPGTTPAVPGGVPAGAAEAPSPLPGAFQAAKPVLDPSHVPPRGEA